MNLTMVPVTADNREEISRLRVAAGQEAISKLSLNVCAKQRRRRDGVPLEFSMANR